MTVGEFRRPARITRLENAHGHNENEAGEIMVKVDPVFLSESLQQIKRLDLRAKFVVKGFLQGLQRSHGVAMRSCLTHYHRLWLARDQSGTARQPIPVPASSAVCRWQLH